MFYKVTNDLRDLPFLVQSMIFWQKESTSKVSGESDSSEK